jgi:hypothetical protein
MWRSSTLSTNFRFSCAQRGVAGKVLGGWQVTGVTQFQTGTPITVGTGDDFPGIGSPDAKPWNRRRRSVHFPR